MSIEVGAKLPDATMHVLREGRPTAVTSEELFADKKVVLFAVPGAFTPGCSITHLPGFVVHADDIKAKGVDSIVCVSVNDPFVMDAWGKNSNAEELIMVGDGNGEFTEALGLSMNASGAGMSTRSQRYAMIIENGAVAYLAVDAPGKIEASTAEEILKNL